MWNLDTFLNPVCHFIATSRQLRACGTDMIPLSLVLLAFTFSVVLFVALLSSILDELFSQILYVYW